MTVIPIPRVVWVKVNGPDTISFINRLSTAKIMPDTSGQQVVFFLNATGKIIIAAEVLFIDHQTLWFEVYDTHTDARTFLDLLDKFHFGESVSWSCQQGFASYGVYHNSKEEVQDWAQQHGGSLCFTPGPSLWKLSDPSWHRVRLPQSAVGETTILSEASHVWESLRIQNAIPGFLHEITPERNPLECGYARCFDVAKGCYPGQEVVERIRTQGSPALFLCKIEGLWQGPGHPPVEAGKALCLASDATTSIGVITSVAYEAPTWWALGFIKKRFMSSSVDIAVVVQETFLEGLACRMHY